MKIVIASDHGGFELKNKLFEWLKDNNYDVSDLGNLEYDAKNESLN